MTETTRRHVLAAAAGASAAAFVGACGDSEPAATPPPPAPAPTSEPPAGTTRVLAKTSDIPVNGGKIFADAGVVVTQPTSGDFKAFSSLCSHKGCALTSVEDGTINCRCHGARFALADGSVRAGPAKAPLDARTVKVDDDRVTLA